MSQKRTAGRRLALMSAMCVLAATPASTRQDAPSRNWMSEFVEARVSQMTLRATRGRSGLLEPKIVGGTVAGAADNPFQVALLQKNISNSRQAQFCGGTLVKANVVVTAAHCSDFLSVAQVQVLTGTRRLDGTGTRRDVASIKVHPNWNPQTFNNDVAVWKLSSEVTGITFATLATDDGAVGANLLATGWGTLNEGGALPIDLMKVEVPLVDRSNCNDANSYNGAITDAMLCAGRDQGGKDTCQGDSGGPLTRGAGNTVLTGITSWGIGCARPNYYGVYTRVSQAGIRTFIQNNY